MKNIILIGMPGCGKSTVGVVLAKALGYGFIDSDLMIQSRERKRLCDIISEEGRERFNEIEEEVNADLWAEHCVIATGGSVIYGPKAMEHLKELGTVIYIRLSYESVEHRLGDLNERGVSLAQGQTLRDLYEERIPLYEKYADITIDADEMMLREVVECFVKMNKED